VAVTVVCACGADAPASSATETPAALVAAAGQALTTLHSVHIDADEQPYKDAESTAKLLLTPGGVAGTVEEDGVAAEVRVVGATLYVHGLGFWESYDTSGRLAAAIGTSWVRATNIGQSSAELLLEGVELSALRALLSDFSPRTTSTQTVDGVRSVVLQSDSLTLAVTASTPHRPVLMSSVPPQPPSVGLTVHFSGYDDGGTVTAPADAKDVCEVATSVGVTLPGC